MGKKDSHFRIKTDGISRDGSNIRIYFVDMDGREHNVHSVKSIRFEATPKEVVLTLRCTKVELDVAALISAVNIIEEDQT